MRPWSLLILFALIAVGCGSQPIPRLIVEGTSGTITLPGDMEIGYGRAWSKRPAHEGIPDFDPSDPDEDLQRGEILLYLLDDQGANVKDALMNDVRLPVRFISRAQIDSAATEAYSTASAAVPKQVIVVFDVPPNLVADGESPQQMQIQVQRVRRDITISDTTYVPLRPVASGYSNSSTPAAYTTLGWAISGFGEDPTDPIPITIMDHPNPDASEPILLVSATQRSGWGFLTLCDGGLCNTTMNALTTWENLDHDYVPNSEFSVLTEDATAHPAAWEFDVDYPAHRMLIVGVSLERKKPGEAYLAWDPQEAPDNGCIETTRVLNIKVADPDALTRGVNIAFQLRHTDSTTTGDECQRPIEIGDLMVNAATKVAYDENGGSITFPDLLKKVSGEN